MRREELGDLYAFLTVAEEQSFTRAARRLETSQSALSHTLRRLETHLGVRLLTRTTRSVAPTQAGERLIRTLRPAIDGITSELTSVRELRDRPAGTIRITLSEHAATSIVWPALKKFAKKFPDIHVELTLDSALRDIVAERFDAGVRLGEAIAKDMIAVRIGPDVRMIVVGAPSYFAAHGKPNVPQDLAKHTCINLRLQTSQSFYAWEFQKGRRQLRVRVEGQLAFNDVPLIVEAAAAGFGLAFVMEDHARSLIAGGKLVEVLSDWTPPFAGYYLYYPSRRQPMAAFSSFVEALRYKA